jgi:hypothetical protein
MKKPPPNRNDITPDKPLRLSAAAALALSPWLDDRAPG